MTGFTWILVARLMAVIYDMRFHVACAEGENGPQADYCLATRVPA